MKLTLQTQLFPDVKQSVQLRETMTHFNAACSWLAGEAFKLKTANKVKLQQLFYYQIREKFNISAQMAAICIRHVAGTYSSDKSIKPVFRPNAAMPYDLRILSFKADDRISILTLQGRIVLPIVMGEHQRNRFDLAKKQSDLLCRKDGKWFLLITVEVEDAVVMDSSEFLGVDLGVINIAADSDGEIYTNTETEKVRQRNNNIRRSLQSKGTGLKKQGKRPKNVRRKLKALSGRERRFKANTNHIISKKLVEKAKGTQRGIGLEDLTGIRNSIRFRKDQRDKMSKWAFAELREMIEYKAKLAGVPVQLIDPRNTSNTCPFCSCINRRNRYVRGIFLCRSCGYFDQADIVGAQNIARAAIVTWREVSVAAQAA